MLSERMGLCSVSAAAASVFLLGAGVRAVEPLAQVGFQTQSDKVVVTVAGQPVATYIFSDPGIPRPYFAHVRAPGGVQVTRNHPPVEGVDRTDHAAYHPGIWMAFGALGGSDFWRNRGRVVHERFVAEPAGGPGRGRFAVRNRYVTEDNAERTVCHEVVRYTFLVRPEGYLLVWDSTFSSDQEFAFGDQEEMGLGIRVATPLTVESGGTIVDAQGRKNGRQVWGNDAAWCDYRGTIDDDRVGMAIFCHPDNFRRSWFHARDYGLLVANPFGRRAFGKGEPSSVVVKTGEEFRLRYGILLHGQSDEGRLDLNAAYTDYLNVTRSAGD